MAPGSGDLELLHRRSRGKDWESAFFETETPRTRKVALRSAIVFSPTPGPFCVGLDDAGSGDGSYCFAVASKLTMVTFAGPSVGASGRAGGTAVRRRAKKPRPVMATAAERMKTAAGGVGRGVGVCGVEEARELRGVV